MSTITRDENTTDKKKPRSLPHKVILAGPQLTFKI